MRGMCALAAIFAGLGMLKKKRPTREVLASYFQVVVCSI